MTRPTRKRPRKPSRETSKRVASSAAKLMAMLQVPGVKFMRFEWKLSGPLTSEMDLVEVTELVEAVAGSALTQKTKGKRAGRKR